MGCAFMNLIKAGKNLPFQITIHLYSSSCGGAALRLPQMHFPEQKLPRQITNLDNIRVSNNNPTSVFSFLSPKPQHGIIL